MAAGAHRGFTLLAVLFIVAATGIGLAAASEVWSTAAQRERETELFFVGREFREAIRKYHESGNQYPDSLESLLQDPRSQRIRRYLRRVYADPITGKAEWGLLVRNGRIVGVHSLSERAPLKTGGFEPPEARFADKGKYSEWWFTFPADLSEAGLQSRHYRQEDRHS